MYALNSLAQSIKSLKYVIHDNKPKKIIIIMILWDLTNERTNQLVTNLKLYNFYYIKILCGVCPTKKKKNYG